jgi:ribosomal protein S18 acetylase RimI-like enzyme
MNQPTIRPVQQDDLLQLSALWYEKAALLATQDVRLRLHSDARGEWQRVATTWVTATDCVFLAALQNGAAIGYVAGVVQPAPPGYLPALFGNIQDLTLDVHRFEGGSARALVEAARDAFRAQGVEQIVVTVPRRSAIEQAFWRAYGAAQWMECLWIRS